MKILHTGMLFLLAKMKRESQNIVLFALQIALTLSERVYENN